MFQFDNDRGCSPSKETYYTPVCMGACSIFRYVERVNYTQIYFRMYEI